MRQLKELTDSSKPYLVVAALALGTFLRLYHLNHQSLWLDELYSIVPTAPQNSIQSIIAYCKTDQPPLFFLFIHFAFKLFGYNEMVGRLASALIGVYGVLAMYSLGKESSGKSVGIFAAFLTAINYFHIYYSQELRFYSMAFLFATLSYLFFIKAFKKSKLINFASYVLATASLLYTHYYGLIVFGTQALTFLFLLYFKREPRFILLSVLSGVAVILAFLPWIPVLFNDLGIDTGWMKTPERYFVLQYFYDYTGKDAVAALVLVIFTFLGLRSMYQNSSDRPLFLIVACWLIFSYLVPYIRSILLSPMLNNRYTIVTLPAWLLVFAYGWNAIRNLKWKYYVIPAVLSIGFLVNMIFFKKHYSRIHKSQFREASEMVLAKNTAHDPVFSSLPWHYNYYFRSSPLKVGLLTELTNQKRFWLLQGHFDNEKMEAEKAEFAQNYVVVESYSFYEASAILLERK